MYKMFVSNVGVDQIHITAAVENDKDQAATVAGDIYRELVSILHSRGMRILHERVFGSLDFYEQLVGIRRECLNLPNEPFSYIEGKPCRGEGLAGIQIHAVKPAADKDFWVIRNENRPCGRGWRRGDTTYIHLTGIAGSKKASSRGEQTWAMFDKIARILASQNLAFRHVVRTWIYLADILDWYDEFNSIRTDKFREFDLIPDKPANSEIDKIYLPASTGISGKNPAGVSGICDALAMIGDLQVTVLNGVHQRSAYRYGSAFSRGICVQEKNHRQIFVSGTAAIDDQGKSLHPENVEAQIMRTIKSVEALMGQKGAKLKDICSATVHLKRPEDLTIFQRVAERFDFNHLPAVHVIADICRPELLFEVDAMAVVI